MSATNTASQWTEIGHYYAPIPYYGGRVLKYEGIACPMNHARMMAKPGMLMLDAYKGDRITADKQLPVLPSLALLA
jgi:hypothetical protein